MTGLAFTASSASFVASTGKASVCTRTPVWAASSRNAWPSARVLFVTLVMLRSPYRRESGTFGRSLMWMPRSTSRLRDGPRLGLGSLSGRRRES